MPEEKTISVRDLLMITGYKSATINYLSPFSIVGEVAVTLHYADRKESYAVQLSADDLPLFTNWIAARAQE